MKFLERVTLFIFADIMLIISVVLCLLIFGWLDYSIVSNICYKALTYDVSSKIVLVCSVIFILLSIKAIFFSSSNNNEKSKQGILLENESGKLVISGETLQNLVKSTAKSCASAEDISTKIALDKENNLIVFINLTVNPNAIIKELSTNLQAKVKEVIKKSTDLEVKEVNIKIRNIAPKQKEVNN